MELPHPGGIAPAQHRIRAAGQDGRHLARTRHGQRSDEVHAAVEPAQPTRRKAVLHQVGAHAEAQKLEPGDDAVLARGQLHHDLLG